MVSLFWIAFLSLCLGVYSNEVVISANISEYPELSYKSDKSLISVIDEAWEAFKVEFFKNYCNNSEENFRHKVFEENKRVIDKHNQRANKSFTLGINQFGDLQNHEFVALMNGYKKSKRTHPTKGSTYLSPIDILVDWLLPDSVDWRTEGYVTPVKNQGSCGSCWAFSATGSLEGQHYRSTGELVSLSEQNLVDCSQSFGNNGCDGGWMDNAFEYVKVNEGIDTEDSYPYEGKVDNCRFSANNVGATDTGFVDIPSGSETELKEAVAIVGPVSVAIDASHQSFQLYKQGVYDEPDCSSESAALDHGVLVVGYGTTPEGQDYWLVKNSWGTQWGDQGYIKMSRNKKNQCGIATHASYPLV